MKKPKLIHYHDSRHMLFYRHDPPMSLHQLRQPVDEIVGTPVDTLCYGLGMGQTFLYDTQVGTKFGENATEHRGLVWWRAAENFRQALEAGYDPLKVIVDRAHEKGVQVLGSIRINDPGSPDIGSNYNVGRLKYENPEVMIGEEDPDRPYVSTCLDFARQDVREERLAVLEEVCDRYGADGVEIDEYVRVFFKPSEVQQNTPILTEWMRSVRDMLDRVGKKRGERLMLAARVHPNEEANLAVGMDVRSWLSEKLVDVLTPFVPSPLLDTNSMLGDYVDVAHEAGASVYGRMGEVFPYDDRVHDVTVEMFRASAMNYMEAGADGLYLSDLPWPRTEREYMILREMGDPDIYARKAKHYIIAQKDAQQTPESPERQLPVTLEEGVAVRIPVFVGDDLESAMGDGELEEVTLGVKIVQTCPEDQLSFRLNGVELSVDDARVSTYYGGVVPYFAVKSGMPNRINTHYWFEFTAPSGVLRQGENEVEVTMDRHFKALTAERVVSNVEIHVEYKQPPVPVQGQM